ncbi:MAG: site-specific tyrosine recombinase XerC [Candidatus Riflebacteria bacterium]|nr:site-specific tyrosine recombinase XerC [Candidatus Riflebacteria bacterium]
MSKKQDSAWETDEPQGFSHLFKSFFDWMKIRNFSNHTLSLRERNLRFFFQWLAERNLTRPDQITNSILERYQRFIYYNNSSRGKLLSVQSQYTRLQSIKSFFRWLTRNKYLSSNPAADLVLPKLEKRLPRDILTISEVEKIMMIPDITKPLGLRDRAILETLYSTGMRRSELINLRLYDLNHGTGTVSIRLGKGKKDRVIPIGERALAWTRKYIEESRPNLVIEPDERFIFLASNGTSLCDRTLGVIVRNILIESGVGKHGSCHLFRHTMATLMLEGGADIRFIQQMLGHAQLTTTEIYTQVSILKLREIFLATHPGARLKKNQKFSSLAADETADEEEKKVSE